MSPVQNKPVYRRTLDNIIRFTSSIGENIEFTGTFNGEGNIVIRGHVKGESDVNSAVVIAETGSWDGKLTADVVIVAGIVNGDIVAREKIEVLASAKIVGNLSCPVIAIETGAIHEGRLDMNSKTQVKHFQEKRNNPARTSGKDSLTND